jgi:hypothetical protein
MVDISDISDVTVMEEVTTSPPLLPKSDMMTVLLMPRNSRRYWQIM